MRKRKYWSQEEENFIISHIADMSVAELAERFHIDKQRMVNKIHKMGLNSKAARGILWTKEESSGSGGFEREHQPAGQPCRATCRLLELRRYLAPCLRYIETIP
jgi:hypothetical protein